MDSVPILTQILLAPEKANFLFVFPRIYNDIEFNMLVILNWFVNIVHALRSVLAPPKDLTPNIFDIPKVCVPTFFDQHLFLSKTPPPPPPLPLKTPFFQVIPTFYFSNF